MNFEEAEARFRELQARVQRGEPISRAEYEEQVSQLAVQDKNGVLWEINPRTGKWMYFDGAEWVSGAPPGHDTSTVMPMISQASAPVEPPPAPIFAPPPPQPSRAVPPPPPTTPPPPIAPATRVAPSSGRGFRNSQNRQMPKPPSDAPQSSPTQQQTNGSSNRNREWVPLAIGAVVLLACAGILFVGGTFLMNMTAKPTPTRTVVAGLATATKVPTVVALPTNTPIPPTPSAVLAKAPDGANVREKPSVSGVKVTTLAKGAQVTLLAVGPKDGANVWYQINVPGKSGVWVRSDTLQIVSGDPNTLPSAGTATPVAPAATKPPAAPQATPTATVIGVIPPAPKVYP